jgi:hypothetical protein
MAARNGARAARRSRDLPLVDLRRQLVADTSRSLVGVVWRWRIETLGVLLFLAVFGWISDRLGDAAWLVVAHVLVVVLAVGPLRRLVVSRFWCAVTRHRLFAVFEESRVFNRSGHFPVIVHVRRTPVGERAVVWCRPGICAEDLEARVEDIRAACMARDARITRHDKWSQIVDVEIVRRDPLAAETTITPTLINQAGPVVREEVLSGAPLL